MGGLVSSVDFFPTILDLCGLDGSEPLDGVSLLPALTGRADWPRTSCGIASDYQLIHPENPRFHRSGPAGKWRAVISGDHKLIHVPGSPDREWELYDVVTDPGETKNLVEMRPGLREELSAPMAEWEALIDRQSSHHADVDSEAARLLRSLGYIN